MKQGIYIVCPLCGLNRKLNKSGINSSKPIRGSIEGAGARFDRIDPRSSPFIDIRDMTGGRSSGFPRVGFSTLEDVMRDVRTQNGSGYTDLIDQLRMKCKDILSVIGE